MRDLEQHLTIPAPPNAGPGSAYQYALLGMFIVHTPANGAPATVLQHPMDEVRWAEPDEFQIESLADPEEAFVKVELASTPQTITDQVIARALRTGTLAWDRGGMIVLRQFNSWSKGAGSCSLGKRPQVPVTVIGSIDPFFTDEEN